MSCYIPQLTLKNVKPISSLSVYYQDVIGAVLNCSREEIYVKNWLKYSLKLSES